MRDEGYATGPIGGTTDFRWALGSDGSGNWERFNINQNYPPGVFLVSAYTSEAYQGHNTRVYSWEDSLRNQYMAQDDAGDGTWWGEGWLWGSSWLQLQVDDGRNPRPGAWPAPPETTKDEPQNTADPAPIGIAPPQRS